jgi:WD40 repeat protein
VAAPPLAAAPSDKKVAEVLRFEHSAAVTGVAFSPDSEHAAAACADGTIRLWNFEAAREIQRFAGHEATEMRLCFLPDGRRIVSGSNDKTVRVWDVESGRELRRMDAGVLILSLAVSPDGRFAATGDSDSTIGLWDLYTVGEMCVMAGHTDNVNGVAFSADGRRIVSGSDDQTVRVWDAGRGTELMRFETGSGVGSVALSPDSRYALSGGGLASGLGLWDVETGQQIPMVGGLPSDRVMVTSVAISPDGQLAIWGDILGRVHVAALGARQESARMEGHEGSIRSVAISPDQLLIVSGGKDRTMRLWFMPM